MPERSAFTELGQIGVESVYGTSVAATKRLAALGIDLAPQFEATRFRSQGYKLDTLIAPNREWASGTITGYPTYNELVYIFNSLLKKVTGVTASSATTWTWDWSPSSVETIDSFTIEQGDAATRAHKVVGGIVTDFNMGFTRSGEPDLGGTILAKAFTDGITPTSSLTADVPKPILPGHIDVYVDSTWAGLGTTKLLKVTNAGFGIGSMFGPFWTLNSANTSFYTTTQQLPDMTASLGLAADSAGAAYFTQMRAGTPVFMRLKATGPIFTGAIPYSLTVDMSGIIDGPPAKGEDSGVLTYTWPIRLSVDATTGKAFKAVLVNDLATI